MDIPTPLLLLLVSVTHDFYLPLEYYPAGGSWDVRRGSPRIDLVVLEGVCDRESRMPGEPESGMKGDVYSYMYICCMHRKTPALPLELCYIRSVDHKKLACRWWREPIPFLGDSLVRCRIRSGVRPQRRRVVRLRPELRSSRLWRRFPKMTNGRRPSYRFAPSLLVRSSQEACNKFRTTDPLDLYNN
jgi:hypothetical protein